jgi:Ca2+/Na+ antiporter
MELILQKSYGPIAQLKRGYRKQIVFMSLLPFVLLLTNADNIDGVFRSVMYWSYVVFCFAVIVVASMNYRETAKMENQNADVKTNLETQVKLLQTRLDQLIIGLRVALIYFIILTEVLPFFQHYRMLTHWHALSPFIRFGAYAALLAMQYMLSRRVLNSKFGRHLTYLKELANQI